jgi:hypothetical protein
MKHSRPKSIHRIGERILMENIEHEVKVTALYHRLLDLLNSERNIAVALDATCTLHVNVLDTIIGKWAGDKMIETDKEIAEIHCRLEKTSQEVGNA